MLRIAVLKMKMEGSIYFESFLQERRLRRDIYAPTLKKKNIVPSCDPYWYCTLKVISYNRLLVRQRFVTMRNTMHNVLSEYPSPPNMNKISKATYRKYFLGLYQERRRYVKEKKKRLYGAINGTYYSSVCTTPTCLLQQSASRNVLVVL